MTCTCSRWSERGLVGLLWVGWLCTALSAADQSIQNTSEDTSSAEQNLVQFYVGFLAGTAIHDSTGPLVGFRGGLHPLSGSPGFALEVARGWAWLEGERDDLLSLSIVLGSRTRKPRGYYFRLGTDIAAGMKMHYREAVFFRPEIALAPGYLFPWLVLSLGVEVYL